MSGIYCVFRVNSSCRLSPKMSLDVLTWTSRHPNHICYRASNCPFWSGYMVAPKRSLLEALLPEFVV
ncbi:hypothetical protein CSPAE12_02028 [Colletotrichum incanum]|nr:hypothetical protein CSPAE12_02028 [Colletotrichum incanum]